MPTPAPPSFETNTRTAPPPDWGPPQRAYSCLEATATHPHTAKELCDEQREPDLDLRLETRGRDVLECQGQVHRPAQSDLVDRCRAHRIFGLADLEHRCDQASGRGLPFLDRRAVSARGAARADRRVDALSLYLRGHDLRRQELDHLQCGGAVHSDAGARL